MITLYKIMMQVAGRFAPQFRRTLCYSLAAAMFQAMSWVVLLPLFRVILQEANFPLLQALAWLALFFLLLVAEAVLRIREMAFTYNHWHNVTEDVRLRLAATLRRTPLELLASHKSGDLAVVLGSNVTMAATAISSLATLFVQLVTVPLVLMLLVAWLDWRLGAILLTALLLILPIVNRVRRQSNIDFQQIDNADGQAGAGIVEYVQGMAMLRATGQAGAESPVLQGLFEQQHHAQAASNSTTHLLARAQWLAHLSLVVLVAAATGLTVNGQLSLAALLSVTVIAAHLAEPLAMGMSMLRLFELASAALKRIDAILNLPEMASLSPSQRPSSYSLALENVSFHYQNQTTPAVNNITLEIAEKSFTALVGPSGSGKTTLTRLISRFADPQQGVIRLGDVDLRHISPETLMQYITVVFQDVWLFDDTIASNIALGKPGAAQLDIEQAARKAHIHHVITQLPQGYNTRVGEAGSALSGGERQRISIARAILKDAPVVLLDEPTSALDSESEYHVQRAIESLIKDKTVVVVAHRLSTIRAADQIAFIEDGYCPERGTHDALMALPGGRYRQMVTTQRYSQAQRTE